MKQPRAGYRAAPRQSAVSRFRPRQRHPGSRRGEVEQHIATGIIGEIDQHFGEIDDIVAMWKVRKARETAWLNAEIIWRLGPPRSPRPTRISFSTWIAWSVWPAAASWLRSVERVLQA
ncbi:MAG: DUF5995 family protein [Candidatus Binatia bacterium]